MPFEDNTFDVVTNAVSVDYLTRPLEMMKEVNRVLKPGGLAVMSFSNRCFVRTDGAVLAMMDGGPDEPQRLEDGTWRVLAPGFAVRLFFVGPAVEFFPVNEFEVVHSDDDDAQVAQVKLKLNRGSMQGTPASVVDWINKAYTTDRTTTVVTVDTSLGKVVTSVDVRISITVPKLFSIVPVRKIESAMEASAAASTESALRTVCEAVVEAWVTCNTAEGTLRV